ncbi:MAG: MFS transporter [Deltaproteobacteria bacterium]|nr:MFS transporter [Deltaproteobacteria bacterium]
MAKIFYGWWIILASSALTTYNGGILYYGFTAFFNPILNEFGWSRAATSFAFSLQRLEGGIAAPIVGYFIDKLGPRKMSLFAVTIFGFGFLMLSRVDSLVSFYIAFLVISAGHSAGFYSVGAVTVANWFVRKRGRAMGFLTGGVCLAGTIVPLLVWLINLYGWRRSLVITGVGMWVLGIPLSLVFRHRPEQYGMLPDGDSIVRKNREPPEDTAGNDEETSPSSVSAQRMPEEMGLTAREAIKTRSFWLLAVGLSISFMAMSAVFVHIMPFLESIGISRERAGFVVTFTILLSVMGRVGFGWLSDYMDKRYVFCIALALQAIGLLFFANIRALWHIVIFLITFSPGYGGPIPLRPAIQGEYFGRKQFGTIQGLLLSISTVSSMTGPPFAGWICDVTGSYRLAFLILSAIPAIGIILFILIPPARQKLS